MVPTSREYDLLPGHALDLQLTDRALGRMAK